MIDFPHLGMQKTRDFVFEYCPRGGYIEGGYYFFTRPSTAGIIRMRVLFEGWYYCLKVQSLKIKTRIFMLMLW